MSQQEHIDFMGRLRWNAFKYAYRKSHPTEIRNSKYYANVRKLYKDQGVPTLYTWLTRFKHGKTKAHARPQQNGPQDIQEE